MPLRFIFMLIFVACANAGRMIHTAGDPVTSRRALQQGPPSGFSLDNLFSWQQTPNPDPNPRRPQRPMRPSTPRPQEPPRERPTDQPLTLRPRSPPPVRPSPSPSPPPGAGVYFSNPADPESPSDPDEPVAPGFTPVPPSDSPPSATPPTAQPYRTPVDTGAPSSTVTPAASATPTAGPTPSASVTQSVGEGPRYQYMVSLRKDGVGHYCTGALVSKQFVVTSAQCVDSGFSSDAFGTPTMYIGGGERENPVEVRHTSKVIYHPQWRRDLKRGADIALIQLDRPVDLQPLNFPKQQIGLGDNEDLKGLGWGRTAQGSSHANTLQQAPLPYMEPDKCAAFSAGLPDGIMCAGGSGGAMCKGDEGSPILRDGGSASGDLLVGIASFHEGNCGQSGIPGMFTRVDKYGQWISDNVF